MYICKCGMKRAAVKHECSESVRYEILITIVSFVKVALDVSEILY